MLDDFAKRVMETLMSEMQAIDPRSGLPDHKTRIAALKESRTFLANILPRLTEADRQKVSHAMASGISESLLSDIKLDEERLTRLRQTTASPSVTVAASTKSGQDNKDA